MDAITRGKLAGELATLMGTLLRQSYRMHEGAWWLFTGERPIKPIPPDEVQWHVARRHAPFVPGGIQANDPRWWDEPRITDGT